MEFLRGICTVDIFGDSLDPRLGIRWKDSLEPRRFIRVNECMALISFIVLSSEVSFKLLLIEPMEFRRGSTRTVDTLGEPLDPRLGIR